MNKPCQVCGDIFNSTRKNRKLCSDACREEMLREHGRNNYNKHRSSVLEKKRKHYQENKEALRAAKREWRKHNPDRDAEIQRKSRDKHRDKRRRSDNAYRKGLREEAQAEISVLKETLDTLKFTEANRALIQDLVDHINDRRELRDALDYYWLGAAEEFLEDV